jgi:hypothetical protein
MPCNPLIKDNKVVGFMCSRGRSRAKPCVYCKKPSTQLCDFPIEKLKNGKFKTCDMPLCLNCSQKGVSNDTDFCKPHFELAKEAYQRRLAKV